MGVRKIAAIAFGPAKDRADVIKHGVSLVAAEEFGWDTALEREDDRFDDGEVQFVALGLIGDRTHVLVYTEGSQADAIRAISLHPAEKHAVRFYHGQV
nr:BrnT family toxin [Methylobacterium sp. GC_Met_2]